MHGGCCKNDIEFAVMALDHPSGCVSNSQIHRQEQKQLLLLLIYVLWASFSVLIRGVTSCAKSLVSGFVKTGHFLTCYRMIAFPVYLQFYRLQAIGICLDYRVDF